MIVLNSSSAPYLYGLIQPKNLTNPFALEETFTIIPAPILKQMARFSSNLEASRGSLKTVPKAKPREAPANIINIRQKRYEMKFSKLLLGRSKHQKLTNVRIIG